MAEMGDGLWVSGFVVYRHLLSRQVLVSEGVVDDLAPPVLGDIDWSWFC